MNVSAAATFDIAKAVTWSNNNAESGFSLCSEYVADCLNAGGLGIDKKFTTFNYGCVGATVARCSTLFYYLRDKLGCTVIYNPSASDVEIGDVVFYDGWYSYNMSYSATIGRGNYDTIGHAAFVVAFFGKTPLVNQHNNNRKQINWDMTNMGTKLLVKTSALSGKTSTPQPTTPANVNQGVIINVSSYYTPATDYTIRYSAGFQIPLNAKVIILDSAVDPSDGVRAYKVNWNGNIGWVSERYIRIL